MNHNSPAEARTASRRLRDCVFAIGSIVFLGACATTSSGQAGSTSEINTNAPDSISAGMDARIAAIHTQVVFADMHAHPSRFHRANVAMVSADEVALYQRAHMDLAVANISADAPYSGRYWLMDDTEIPRGQYKPEPGSVFAFAMDRMQRLQMTFDQGIAVPATDPVAVLRAKIAGKFALMPALEGADALEGNIENFYRLHERGLRLIQLVHFRANELGHIQTWPYSPGGLTEFGKQVVREANRLGVIIDLAHSNTETINDVLALSNHPVIFSHGGLKSLKDQDRALSDDEVRAIAANGGVIGIWPNGRHIQDVARMVDFIEYAIGIAGADHVGIGSDLRGMARYSKGFSREAEFRAIAQEMLTRGFDDDTVGKVMGGNFFRVWTEVVASPANR